MAKSLDSGSDEEFEGFPCAANQSTRKKKRKLVNKALESTEDDEDDDSDDFKGSIKSSGRKRKALEAFESDDDDSGSDENVDSINDDDDDEDNGDDDDTDDGDDNDDDEDGIETEDTLDVDLNDDDDDIPSNSDQCPICLMSLGGQKLGTPSECKHVFCLACIMEWSKNANTCPVDRKVFREIMVHLTKKGAILERIPVEDRSVPEIGWEQQPTFCEVCHECDREDRMLLCDGCDKGYHLECLRPRLYTVPAGSWYCTTCIEIRRNEQMEEEEDSVPDLLPGNTRRSRGTVRASTRSETSSETNETDRPQRARTAASNRRRSSSTRGRGRGRGRTGSRSSGRGRSRSSTTARSRTGSTTRRGRGGKKKTRKRTGRTSSTTSKPKRKKRKTTTTKKKRRSTTKSKAKKRKADNEYSYHNPFEAQSLRGRTPRERLNNNLRATGSASDPGRGLGTLSIFGDHYALNGFEDDSTNEPEQSDSSSVKSGNSDILGSIFNGIETLHDENATVSRDGRVLPSESDKRSPNNKGSQIKGIESGSSNENLGILSREVTDIIYSPRDLRQREGEKLGNQSISRYHNEGHVTSKKANDGHQSNDRSRDDASFMTLSRDQTGNTDESSVNPPLGKKEQETIERNEHYQTDLQNVAFGSNKLHEKPGAFTEKIQGATLESKYFRESSRNNSSATSDFHKKSTKPKLKSGPSSKLPSPTVVQSSSSVSSSKRSLKELTHSPATYVRFKIPKKSSPSLDSSCCREKESTGALDALDSEMPHSTGIPDSPLCKTPVSTRKDSSRYDKLSSQDSKVSHSTGIPDSPVCNSPVCNTPISTRKDASQRKRVSPILWTDKDKEIKKLPEFKVDDNTCRANSTTVCPIALLPRSSTPSSIPLNNEITSSQDKKISSSSDLKNDFTSLSTRNLEENYRSRKLDDVNSDLRSIYKSHRSAFSPVAETNNKQGVDGKQEKLNMIPTTAATGDTSLLGNQNSKPSLQHLPTSLRTSSPLTANILGTRPSSSGLTGPTNIGSPGGTEKEKRRGLSPLSRLLGPRPSTGLTGSASTGLSRKTDKQSSPGQDARVIRFTGGKGEIKIKVVPSQDETHPSLRSLPEETNPVLRTLPEDAHPALRTLPEEAHPALRSLPEEPHPALRSLPEEPHPALRSLPEEPHPALRTLPEEVHPASRTLPDEFLPTLRSLPPPSIVEPPLPLLNTAQQLSSLKPLKRVAKQPARPKLKMLSTSETSQPTSNTLTSGVQPSREFSNRTIQNLAIIQMLRHKTSSLRTEVENGHSFLRKELESSRREEPETEPDSISSPSSTSSARPPLEGSLGQQEFNSHRPKLSSLLGSPRNPNLPVAVVRPSLSSAASGYKNPDAFCHQTVSFAGFADSDANGSQSLESEREKNRRKGIARLQRIERIKGVIKDSLQPYYDHNEITRQDFKEIFIRAVDKVKDSNHEIDRHRIALLVKKYVKMFKGLRVIGAKHDINL